MYFKNKVVWITGASSGIGLEAALQLARQGASLILTARRINELENTRKNCLEHTDNCEIIATDLLDNNNLINVTKQAIATYGHIDIVIHSAGVSQRSLAVDTSLEVYRKLLELNFFAPLTITQLLLPHFAERKSGHIVALSSMAGLMGFPMRTGYAAAKHALKGYFETLQTENTISGLNITIVHPGRIKTPISFSALTEDGKAHGKMDAGQENGIPVEVCVQKILKGIELKKKNVIIAKGERLLWWFWWFIPSLYYRIANKKGLN